MDADDVEKPQIPPHNHRDGHHFPVGSLVEVYVNEATMGGVYFSATVVPPPLSPRKTNTQNSGEKLHVKYENLLARKNGSDRLRECVDISSVRPAPPLLQKGAAKRFEPNDVVDASHKDGWWKGVVSRVVGGGERFVVTFEKPPVVLEFGPSALRAHWDWADGVWTGPLRKGKMGNPAFEAGAKVEISIDAFEAAWFPAAIVRDLGNGAYLVETKDKNGELVEAEVDFGHIRPCPPIFRERKFGIWDKVDAFFDFGWWSGLIKEKVGKDGYIVFSELTNWNKQLKQSELRLHMDWRDVKWFICGGGTAALKSNSNDSGEYHKSQTEHANQETEHIVDQERRSKRKQDRMLRTPSPIHGSVPLQWQWVSSSKRRKPRVAKNYQPPNENANQESQLIDEASMEHNTLPFVKRSAVWEAVESMEVLREMPQRPHFEPLRFFKENEREGLAIGCMVTFSNLVETARGLKFSDPRSVVDGLHEALLDLEAHGFEAGGVRELVVKMMAAKEEEQRLVDQTKRIKDEIEERGCRRSKIESEIQGINEHIVMLREQLGMSEMERAKEVEEIEHLQAGLEDTHNKIECLAASVFQL